MKTLRKCYDGFFLVVEGICVLFLALMVAILAYSVFMRYVMRSAPSWGDELALFCVIWYGLLSASVALKEDRHIRINFWGAVLPPKVMKILELVVHIFVFLFLIWFFTQAVGLTALAGATRLTGSGIPLKYMYAAEPVSFACMILAAAGRISEIIVSKS